MSHLSPLIRLWLIAALLLGQAVVWQPAPAQARPISRPPNDDTALRTPLLVVTPSQAAPGAELRIAGAGFNPNSTLFVRIPARTGGHLLGEVTTDAQGLWRGRYLAPDLPAADYQVQALSVDEELLSAAPLAILPALGLSLDPASGLPGTTIQYTVTNARPGTLRIVFGGVPVVYDTPIGAGSVTGSFIVPQPVNAGGAEASAVGADVTVEATNFVVGQQSGRAARPFNRGAPPAPPTYRFQNVRLSQTNLAPGDLFTISGRVDPPPVGALDTYQLHVLFRHESGKTIPIGLSADLQIDGSFEASAVWPSLLRGMPGSHGGEVGVVLSSASSGVANSSYMPAIKPGPPVLRIQVIGVDGRTKTAIQDAVVRAYLDVPLPPLLPDEEESAGVHTSHLYSLGDHQLSVYLPQGPSDPFACKTTDTYGRTDANGIFTPKLDWELSTFYTGQNYLFNGLEYVSFPQEIPKLLDIPIQVNAGWQGYGRIKADGGTDETLHLLYNRELNRFYDPDTMQEVDADPFVVELPKLPAGFNPKIPIEPVIDGAVKLGSTGVFGTFVSLAAAAQDPSITFNSFLGDPSLKISFVYNELLEGSLQNVRLFVDNVDKGAFVQVSADCSANTKYEFTWLQPHLMTPGKHTLQIRAESATGLVQKSFSAQFETPPAWILNPAYSNRTVFLDFYRLGRVDYRGHTAEGTSAVGANVPSIGLLDNASNSQGILSQSTYFSGKRTFAYDGETTATAFNKPSSAQAVPDANHETPSPYGTVFGDSYELFDSGWIPLFRNQWGIWPIASATLGADFWFNATFSYQGTVTLNPTSGAASTHLLTEPAANAKVKTWFDLSAIFGLVKAGVAAIPGIGMSLPVEFTNGAKTDVSKCFRYMLDVEWWAKVGKCPGCLKKSGVKNIFDGAEPEGCGLGGSQVTAAQTEMPPVAAPALATDGLGTVGAVWTSDEGNVMGAIYDGGWVQAVVDADQGASDPAIAFYAPNRGVAVWAETSLSSSAPLTESVKAQQLVYATLQGHTWSAASALTTPSTGDGNVVLAACPATEAGCPDGGAVTAVWVHDAAGALAQRQFRLRYATFQNGAWSAAQPVDDASSATDTAPAVAYFQGKPVVFWVRDTDRSLATLDDHRIVYRVLDGSPIQSPTAFPAAAETPSVAVSGSQIALAFVVAHDPAAFIGNQRTLFSAQTTCPTLAGCNWTVKELRDEHGRTLRAESPQVVFDAAGAPIVTARGLGFGPDAAGQLQAYPGDPVGMLQGSGELLQVEAGQSLTYHTPTYLTGSGAVNWDPTALYEPVGGTVWSLAVQDPTLVHATTAQADLAAQTPTPVGPLVAANQARLPDFVVEAVALSPALGPARGLHVDVQVRNLGVAAASAVDLVVSQDGGYGIGTTVGSATLPALGAGEGTMVTVALTPVGNYSWPHTLLATVNPTLAVAERTIANNRASLEIGGLPPPANLTITADAHSLPIVLTWTPPEDRRVVGYRIYRSDDGGPYVPLGVSDVPGYADLQAAPQHTYAYHVTSFNASGEESPATRSVGVELLSLSGNRSANNRYFPWLAR